MKKLCQLNLWTTLIGFLAGNFGIILTALSGVVGWGAVIRC